MKDDKLYTCLWFNDQAEEAANFYVSVLPDSRIHAIARYSEVGYETHKRPAGSVMTVDFDVCGRRVMGLNGGPHFTFNEAMSLVVDCETQEEIDRYWNALTQGGDPKAQQCGWLKDKYGVSWQINARIMNELMLDKDQARVDRMFAAMLKMKKLDIAALQGAFDG